MRKENRNNRYDSAGMSIFEQLRQRVTARDAAEYYGLAVKPNGMARCPFHPDRTPSMKIDRFYYCFGCGATGDAVDYVARAFGLSQIEAARKLCEDFHLEDLTAAGRNSPKEKARTQRRQDVRAEKERVLKQFRRWIRGSIERLKTCENVLQEMFEQCCPQQGNGYQFTDDYAFACFKRDIVAYWLDILCLGTEEERCEFFLHGRKEVDSVVESVERRAGRAFAPAVGSA